MKYKFIQSVVASNFRRLDMPLKLSYAVTYRCNLKCKMCRIWNKDSPSEELQPDCLESLLKDARGIYWFGITGGEPFLRDDIYEIAEVALKNCPDLRAIHFATNGTLTDRIERFMSRLRKTHENAQIVATISIDGPPPLHDRIRGREGVWSAAIESFKLLRKFPYTKPQFGFTLSHHNLGRFEEAFHALKEVYPPLRFDDITVNIFQRSSFYYENQDMPGLDKAALVQSIKNIQGMDNDGLSLNNFLRRAYLNLYLKYLKTGKPPLTCQSFSSTAFLDPCGNLFPCAVYQRKLLNVKESGAPLKAIWQFDEALKIRRECARNECPGCWSPCDAYSAIGGSLIPAVITS
ncbi:MAG: radical SAM protein [Candidatus Omnitrophota bacterium]